ncbi:MAG: bifunctional serine/threonine protein kinase/MFS transporter [Myxococcota bacterium]
MVDKPGDEAAVEGYRAALRTVGVDLDTVKADVGMTIAGANASWRVSVDSLPRLAVAGLAEPPRPTADLKLLDKLGEGGMGQVWVANQVPLDRRVAVKQLRNERHDEPHRVRLLREALVTGALEHPNIVPVHTLGRSKEGGPLIVMKYIEGRPWRDDFGPLYGQSGEIDGAQTERQLGIFMQICNALSFAHAQGVVHRDIKPENIMIGSFGEVYLLDWGIAVSTEPGGKGPSAADSKGIEGTPGYMAPEMAACEFDKFDARTDVYLMGGLLHELVLGSRRNEGDSLVSVLTSAFTAAPYEYDAAVPSELAAVCNQACAKDRDDRYASAAELKDAVAAFLRHRSARRLAEGARERLEVLREFDRKDRSRSVEDTDLHASATEARFGFVLSLREWAEGEEAKAGLQETLELMIEYEVRHGNPRAAAALLSELPFERPALAQAVEKLDAELRAEKTRVRELERRAYEADLDVGVRARVRVSWLLGSVLAVTIGALFVSRTLGLHQAGYPDALAVTAILAIAVAWSTRQLGQVASNEADRKVMAGIGVSCGALFALFGLSALTGVDFSASLALAMVVAATAAGCMAFLLDRRLVGASIAFLLTALGVALFPAFRGAILAVGCLAAFGVANLNFGRDADNAA